MSSPAKPSAENRPMNGTEWGLLIALALLWGGSFFFGKVALRELMPLTLAVLRTGIAALFLLIFLRLTGRNLPLTWHAWGAFLVMGLLNNAIPFTLINWGQTQIDSGLAAILNATTPLFTVLLAHLSTADERLTRGRIAGVLLGLCGVAVMIGRGALRGLELAGLGKLAILGAACSYACAGIYGRRLTQLSPVAASCGMLAAATIVMLPLALILDRPWILRPEALTLASVGALAIASTALAYIIYFRLLASAGATNLLLVTFLIPVSGLLLRTLVLRERPDWAAFAGMGLIFLCLAAVDGRLPALLGRRIGAGFAGLAAPHPG